MAAILFPIAANLILTQPDNPRAASTEMLYSLAQRILEPDRIVVTSSANEALQKARELTPPEGQVCVCGSLYLVGEFKALLEIKENSEARGTT